MSAIRLKWVGRCALVFIMIGLGFRVVMHKPANVFTWDAFGYWLYLPLTFVHEDLGMRDRATVEGIFEEHKPSGSFYQAHPAPTGDLVIRYTPGLACLHLPGFLVAHGLAGRLGHPSDGFSLPYQVAALLTYLVIVGAGLWALFGVLSELFGPLPATLALALVVFGTNLFVYFETNPMMTHGYSFALLCFLLRATMSWHRKPTLKGAAAIGLLVGAMALVRPTDALVVLVPLLWPVENLSFLRKVRFIWVDKKLHMALAVFCASAMVCPLFLYWKHYAGSWLWDSYQNPAEGLDWLHPHIVPFLFSFRKGWFIYSPLVVMALWGLLAMWRSGSTMARGLFLFLAVDVYVVSLWTAWWYPGSFGQRAMIQSYPILAIGLGGVLVWLGRAPLRYRVPGYALITAITALSIFQSEQFRRGIWHVSRETRAHYRASFFDLSRDPNKDSLLLFDRPVTADPAFDDAERYTVHARFRHLVPEEHKSRGPGSRRAFRLSSSEEYTPAMEVRFDSLTEQDHAWVKVSAQVWCDTSFDMANTELVAAMSHHGNYGYQARNMSQLGPLQPRRWNNVEYFYLTPDPRRRWDPLRLYGWYRGGATVWMDSLRMESWVPKRAAE